MSDLVNQARSYGGCSEASHEVSELVHSLADRIEQLERELHVAKESIEFLKTEAAKELAGKMAAVALLAAEKALADDLYENKDGSWRAYRKARGL